MKPEEQEGNTPLNDETLARPESGGMSPSSRALDAILVLGFGLRALYIGWGLPEVFEEAMPFRKAWAMWNFGNKGFDFNPHFFNYPAFTIYLNFLVQGFQFCIGYFISAYKNLDAFSKAYQANPAIFIILARFLSVGFDMITMFTAYLLGKEYSNRTTGLIAAFLVAVNPLLVKEAHLSNVDSALACFALLSIYCCFRIYQTPDTKWYFYAAVCMGLAAAAKYNGFFLLPVMVIAHFARQRSAREVIHALVDPRWIWAGILSVLVFQAINPYILLDFKTFFRDFTFESGHMSAGHLGLDPSVTTASYYLFTVFPGSFGYGPLILLGVALLNTIFRWKRQNLILLIFPVVYLIVLFAWKMRAERYLLPAIPPLLVLTAIGCSLSWEFIRMRISLLRSGPVVPGKLRLWALSGAFLALLLIEPTVLLSSYYKSLGIPDSRVLVGRWLELNTPPGSTLGMINFGLRITRRPMSTVSIPFFPAEPDWMAPYYDTRWYSDLDYLVGTDYDLARFQVDSIRFRKNIQYYRTLNTSWKKVFEVNPKDEQAGPAIWVYAIPDSLRRDTLDNDLFLSLRTMSDPATAEPFLHKLLDVSRKKRNVPKTEQLMRWILYYEPNSTDMLKYHALVLQEMGKNEDALNELAISARIDPNQPDVYYLMGQACVGLGMFREAVSCFEKAIISNRTYEPAYGDLERLYEQTGERAKALAVLRMHYALLDPKEADAKAIASEIERLQRR
jgi:hypothetical protein